MGVVHCRARNDGLAGRVGKQMIDFTKELKKFEPVLEVENLENEVAPGDVQDILSLLQYLFAKEEVAAADFAKQNSAKSAKQVKGK